MLGMYATLQRAGLQQSSSPANEDEEVERSSLSTQGLQHLVSSLPSDDKEILKYCFHPETYHCSLALFL